MSEETELGFLPIVGVLPDVPAEEPPCNPPIRRADVNEEQVKSCQSRIRSLVSENKWEGRLQPLDLKVPTRVQELSLSSIDPKEISKRFSEIYPKGKISQNSRGYWIEQHALNFPQLYWMTLAHLAENGDDTAEQRIEEAKDPETANVPEPDSFVQVGAAHKLIEHEDDLKPQNRHRIIKRAESLEFFESSRGNHARLMAFADWAYSGIGWRGKKIANRVSFFVYLVKTWPGQDIPFKHIKGGLKSLGDEEEPEPELPF